VAEDREVREKELWKLYQEQAKDLREVMKSDFKSIPLDLEGHVEMDWCIIDLQSEEVELRGDKTREV
jgi:hypothetical protein